MPHKRLTRPERVFEFFFSGVRAGRGRENILRLEVSHLSPRPCQPAMQPPGTLPKICTWETPGICYATIDWSGIQAVLTREQRAVTNCLLL